jgi:ATP-binding cassette subfamily C protein
MSKPMQNLTALVRHLLAFTGWRAALLVVLMVAAALSEGIGLLLLIPLLAFVGITPSRSHDNDLIQSLAGIAQQFEISLNLEVVLAIFLLLICIRQFVIYVSARLSADTRIDYTAAVRKEFFAAIGETSWRFLNGQRLTQVGQVLLIDCRRIGEAALMIIRILSGLILMLANAAVAVLLSPFLALIILGTITLLTLFLSNRVGAVQAQGHKVSRINNDVYRAVENLTDNLRVAKMAGAVPRIQEQFGATLDQLSVEQSGFVKETESTRMTLQLLGAVAVAASLLIAVRLFGASGPELLLLIFIAARFIPRISVLNQDTHSLMHHLPAFAHAYDVLRDSQAYPDSKPTNADPPSATKSIGLRDVFVAAEADLQNVRLAGVTLRIGVRETVAIEGPSGAGKSTLADVLSGLLAPDRGDILIDGEPLSEQRAVSWRSRVGYVAQTAVLLEDTIRRNLDWVLPMPASVAEMELALRCAGIAEAVAELPLGLDTVIDRREGTLSGGERQRLAIARELLRRPELLILDEATNALDVDTESQVLDNIRKEYAEMTVLIIAHRPTAIEKADRVVRMRDGKIIDGISLTQVSA